MVAHAGAPRPGRGRLHQHHRRWREEAEHRRPGVHGARGHGHGGARKAARLGGRPGPHLLGPLQRRGGHGLDPVEQSRGAPAVVDRIRRGSHAALHGLLTLRGERLETEMRLYDLTSPEHRLIAAKKFEGPTPQPRRLAHKIADEVVLQFTGEPGVADTKLAYVEGPAGAKEIWI